MAKAKGASRTTKAGAAGSLAGMRGQIDRIDRQLVKLINDRANVAIKIGRLKEQSGEVVYDPVREEAVLAKALELSPGPLSPACVRAIFRELISGSRSLEQVLKVAFLGPDFTYSHLAAIHRFGQSVEFVPVGTISAVFEAVNAGHVHYGLVPLENSTDGGVADTLDTFTRIPVRICGEVQLWIHHNLLARCPRGDIQEVYSKPQVLSQCRNWLAKHLPLARTIEVTSTGAAAQLAQDKRGAAAIASRQAGVHYGLDVLAEEIEDNRSNRTRFAVISQHTGPRSGHDKTALMFEIEHRPGRLAEAIGVFKRNGLNLTWIESFPINRPEGGYMFFAELEGHEHDKAVLRTIASLQRKTVRFEVLGSYAKTRPVG